MNYCDIQEEEFVCTVIAHRYKSCKHSSFCCDEHNSCLSIDSNGFCCSGAAKKEAAEESVRFAQEYLVDLANKEAKKG